MDKSILLDKVKKGGYTKDQLFKWIECLPGSVATKKPDKHKKGDVYMHPVFRHPYILLECNDNGSWICGLLTSDADFEENLEPCRSRFFVDSYFTKTLFTVSVPVGSWCNVFDNAKQIKSVLIQLRNIFLTI